MESTSKGLLGAIFGLLIALPIAALFYLSETIASLPFLPADLMNWIIPFVPGDLLTLGINTMVDIILAFDLGREDTVAKLFETLSAAMLFAGILAGLGAVYRSFIYEQIKEKLPTPVGGIIIAIVVAIPLVVISDYELTGSNPFYSGPSLFVRSAWIAGLLVVWGALLHLALDRFTKLTEKDVAQSAEPVAATPAVAPDTTPSSTPAMASAGSRGSVQAINRRQFLVQVGGTAATLTVIGAGLGSLFDEGEAVVEAVQENFSFANYPNANARVQPAPGTRLEYTPLEEHYRIDINSSSPPEVDGDSWRLTVSGLVDAPQEFTLDQLRDEFAPLNQYVTMSCISNRIGGSLISNIGWTGVSMQDILDVVRPSADATHIKMTSADGFFEYVDLETIRNDNRVMLSYAWDEKLLLQKHGFPLRIYIPDHYGMKQPKWLVELEFVSEWQPGYWVERGWSRTATVQATSVIDTVSVNNAYEDENGQTLIPIGGIAYAGDRGISKVEVQVDSGEWVEADLRDPLAQTSWVIWRYDWPIQDGEHTFAVRCFDGSGEMQIVETNRNKPNGATGVHTFEETV